MGRPSCDPARLDIRCVNWRRPGTFGRYRWRFHADGEFTTRAVSGPLTGSHCDVATAAAEAGVGIAYVLQPPAAVLAAMNTLLA